MTQEGLEIKLETLTDMLPLLHATQNPSLDLGTRSLIYDIGSWKGEKPTRGNRILLPEERLPSFRHLWKPELWQSGTYTPFHNNPQH